MNELFFYFYLVALGITSIGIFFLRGRDVTLFFYVLYSLPLVIFTVARPFHLMRDDRGYLGRFENQSLSEFGLEKVLGRDPLYDFSIALAKALWNEPRSMLVVAGIVLIVKLYLLYKISVRNKLLVLFVYACVFWQLHDLTQLRVSMAVMFFLLFLYLSEFKGVISRVVVLIGASASHIQALPAFLLFNKKLLITTNQFFMYLLLVFILLFLNLYPNLSFLSMLINTLVGDGHISDSFQMYGGRAISGSYDAFRTLPIILAVSLLVYLVVSQEFKREYSFYQVQLAYKSIMIGATLAFLFASMTDVQVRFYEFFFVGGLMLVGMVRTIPSLIACLLLGALYFVKFNVTWSIWKLSLL